MATVVKMNVSIASELWSFVPQQIVTIEDDTIADAWLFVGHCDHAPAGLEPTGVLPLPVEEAGDLDGTQEGESVDTSQSGADNTGGGESTSKG